MTAAQPTASPVDQRAVWLTWAGQTAEVGRALTVPERREVARLLDVDGASTALIALRLSVTPTAAAAFLAYARRCS